MPSFHYAPSDQNNQSLLAANEQIFLNSPLTTTVAAGSSGVNVSTFTSGAPGTLDVVSTTSGSFTFPDAGTLFVANASGVAYLSYTGTTSTSFTGVVFLSGQTGTLSTGGAVTSPKATPPISTGVADMISGSIYSDQGGTLEILQSFDGINWDIKDSYTVAAATVNPSNFIPDGITVVAPYMMFLYTNGTTAQNVFRFHVRLYSTGRQGA